jgi:hypothetical protein
LIRWSSHFFKHYTVQHEPTYANHYPYEHFWRTEPANLKIYEVTTDASLSTGTSPILKA